MGIITTTAEHLKEVFDRIGIDGKNYGELHITECRPIAGLAGKLTELESLDELNYLSELLKMQFDDDREKFVAAMEYGDHTRDLQDIINLAQNLDCYWLYPSVQSEEDYGHYLIEELDEFGAAPKKQKNISCRNTGGTLLSMTGADLPSRAISTITATPLHSGTTGATCRRNTRVTPQPPVPGKGTGRP